jgi:transcriptional regulator with XRE-family HTH domain
VELGHRLKLFRVAASLKQPELAERLGVSKNYVYMVESGRREPSLEYLKAFSKEVDVPLSLLFLEPVKRKDAKGRKVIEKVITLLAEYAKVVGVSESA